MATPNGAPKVTHDTNSAPADPSRVAVKPMTLVCEQQVSVVYLALANTIIEY